jgi:DNA-binding HxlR family transcriptional regulator
MTRWGDAQVADAAERWLDEPDPMTATVTTQEVLVLLSRKWVVSVLRELLAGPRRHFQLRCAIRDVQPKVLRETLRFLERDGLVERVLHDDGVGGKAIAYELTELGGSLVEPLVAIYLWGRTHLDEVRTKRCASADLWNAG